MRYPIGIVTVLLAGCATGLGPADNSDAGPADANRRDASVDARACSGGTIARVAPDGSCLVFISTPTTYAAAKASCGAMNAHLAYLKTAALDAFSKQLIGATDTWIGLSDRAAEGTFVWEDGSGMTFSNWTPGEPNNSNGGGYQEDCALVAGASPTKQWDDRPCDASEVPMTGMFAYLCQY